MTRFLKTATLSAVLALMAFAPAMANEYQAKLEALAHDKLAAIASDAAIVAAVKAQNTAHAAYDAAKVDQLDKEWRAEAEKGGGTLTASVLDNATSKHLISIRDGAAGLYAEIFVMDDKGLNVGASNMTSDYMQGDEAKWQKTYGVGPDAILIDEVKQDESSGTFVSQISLPVNDPETKKPIGAVTFGVDVEKLP